MGFRNQLITDGFTLYKHANYQDYQSISPDSPAHEIPSFGVGFINFYGSLITEEYKL